MTSRRHTTLLPFITFFCCCPKPKRELIQGLLDSTEEYVRELQKKIDQADKEYDQTLALVSTFLLFQLFLLFLL